MTFKFPFAAALVFVLGTINQSLADWPTHRGNPQRTGSPDDSPGPKNGKVLWAHKSQEHFIASPVPEGKMLFVSGLGAFNTAGFHALSTEPAAAKRIVWSKTTPYLKLPTVSSPAVAEGKLVFGDGMHQTEGAILHCLRSDTGLALWQLPVSGTLVHLEGSPTIAAGRVYVGAGGGGVLCVDLNHVTLDGKEQDLATVQAVLDKRWKELLAAYEVDKKKDPDFAIAPTEDSLPKPLPKKLWQRGQDMWHVDAPVALQGEQLFVGSAFLDDEKVGERAMFCLKTADGSVLWKVPLKYNPWAGATICEQGVLIGSSSIRFEPKYLPVAKGEVVSVKAEDGSVQWRKAVTGGVISTICVAAKEKLAVFTATDGKLRGWDAQTGAEKWIYDAQTPFFAAPAVSGGVAYAADLKGVVHAVGLDDGKLRWKLDAASDPAVQSPGMIYGSPVVAGGRLYLATCNLEGASTRQPTVVICIGDQ